MKPIKRVAIFCGSKTGNDEAFAREAKELAEIIAKRKIELIYGGGKTGTMGLVADTLMENGGIVRGVIPKVLTEWEHQHDGITELFIVDDMHVRKRKMYELCDAVIILPGGFGTLDELFEVITWNVLAIHDKQIFILNVNGFFDHLIKHLEHVAAKEFLWGKLEDQFTVIRSAKEFNTLLEVGNDL